MDLSVSNSHDQCIAEKAAGDPFLYRSISPSASLFNERVLSEVVSLQWTISPLSLSFPMLVAQFAAVSMAAPCIFFANNLGGINLQDAAIGRCE